jgi:hypothetical protein
VRAVEAVAPIGLFDSKTNGANKPSISESEMLFSYWEPAQYTARARADDSLGRWIAY